MSTFAHLVAIMPSCSHLKRIKSTFAHLVLPKWTFKIIIKWHIQAKVHNTIFFFFILCISLKTATESCSANSWWELEITGNIYKHIRYSWACNLKQTSSQERFASFGRSYIASVRAISKKHARLWWSEIRKKINHNCESGVIAWSRFSLACFV